MPISATDLNKAYLAYFGRPADLTGKTYFATLEQADVINAFDASAESKALYGNDAAAKVNAIYQNLFNRDAEPEGLMYWTTLINQGRVTPSGAAFAILNGAQGSDATAVQNKLAASEAFVAAMDTTAELVGYSGMDAAASARNWLKAVGADAASLTAAVAGAQAAVTAAVAVGGGGVPGATFTLTNGTDTATANVFNAGLVYTPGGNDRINSLQDEDKLSGNNTSADSTLNATLGNVNDNGGRVITPELNDVRILNVAFTGSANTGVVANNAVTDLDLQDATGVKEINITRVTQATNTARIENIKQAVADLSVNNTNANNTGVVEFSYGAGTLAGNNTVALDLNNVQLLNLNIGQNTSGVALSGVGLEGYETINLSSTGSSNAVGVLNIPMDTGTAGKVVITGDKDLRLGTLTSVVNGVGTVESVNYAGGIAQPFGRLASVDASALTGNLTLNMGAGFFTTGKADTSGAVQNVSVAGGKGNDKFILADVIQAGDSLTGGDGTDTLVVVNGGTINAVSSVVSKIENVELRVDGGAGAGVATVDFDKLPDAVLLKMHNEASNQVAFPGPAAPVAGVSATFNLNNLTATHAAGLNIEHSNTGNNGITQNIISANLKSAAGTSDTVILNINEGLNVDPRFNLQLGTQNGAGFTGGVENLTLNDNDSESNTVAQTSFAQHTGTITAKGGVAGTFLNLDTTTVGGNGGLYQYAVNGQADVVGALGVAGLSAAAVGRVADLTMTANQVKSAAATFDASAEASNVIVRTNTNAASVVGAQTIKMGSGNDTVIFDQINNVTGGLSSADTVTGGAGDDTLVIDGDMTTAGAIGNQIKLDSTEFSNVSGFETIRFIGTGVAVTSGNAAGNLAQNLKGGDVTNYRLTLTDQMLAANNKSGSLAIVNDNDAFNDTGRTNAIATAVGGVQVTNADGTVGFVRNDDAQGATGAAAEGSLTVDAIKLALNAAFSYNGEEGATRTADRVIVSEQSMSKFAVLDGGAIDNITNNAGVATTPVSGVSSIVGGASNAVAWSAGNNANAGNADVLQVHNLATVTLDDLSNVKNFGTIEFTNDTNGGFRSSLQLSDTVVDALVDSYQASVGRSVATTTSTAANVEVLQVRALDNLNMSLAAPTLISTTGLNLEAGSLTDKSDVYALLGRGQNNIATGAGMDRVVLLGNFNTATYVAGTDVETGVAINTQANNAAGALTAVAGGAINLGNGADTLVTYGAINLANYTLTGIEVVEAHSAVVITTSQWASLLAARNATNPGSTAALITFSGNTGHQLTIVDDTAGADTIDLTLVRVDGGSLTYDIGNQVSGAGAGVVTISNTPTLNGGSFSAPGVIGTNPTNNVVAASGTAVTAGTTLTLTSNGQNVTENGTGNTTIVVGTGGVTAPNGTWGAFETGDIVQLTASSSLAGVNSGAATGMSTLDVSQAATAIQTTLTAAQYNGFTTFSAAGGDDDIVLTTAGTIAANTNLRHYSVVEGSTLTVGTDAAGLARNVTETGAVGTVSTFILGNGIYAGTFTGVDATDVIRVGTTTDIKDTGITAGVIDFQNTATAGAGLTLTAAQFGGVTFTNTTNAQTVTLSSASTSIAANAGIESYVLGGGAANTITLAAAAQNVTTAVHASNQIVDTGTLTTFSGTLTGNGTATDILNITTTGTNISTGTLTTWNTITLANNVNATMTAAQAALLGTATGTNAVTLIDAFAATAATGVETWNLAAGANTFTFGANTAQTVNQGATGAGTFNITMANSGSAASTVNLSATNAVTDRVAITNAALDANEDDTSVVTINNFVVANDAIRLIDTAATATLTDGLFQTIDLGTPAAVTGEIVEITSTNVVDLTATAADGNIETVIANALGASASNVDRTVILYSGANAGIYHVSDGSGGDIATTDIVVELVAIVTNVGSGNLSVANFY